MTSKEEFQLMKSNPLSLYKYYISIMLGGVKLTDEQVVKFAYCQKVIGIENDFNM